MSLTRSSLIAMSDVKGRIAKLVLSAVEQEAEIHLVGCSTLEHISLHGDTTGALALMNGLPVGIRVKALAEWYRHFSNGAIQLKLKERTWTISLKAGWNKEQFKVDDALAVTFADLTTERDPVTLTLEKFIKGLERTANNSEMFDGTTTPKVAPNVRAVAAQFVASYRKAEAAQPAPVVEAA